MRQHDWSNLISLVRKGWESGRGGACTANYSMHVLPGRVELSRLLPAAVSLSGLLGATTLRGFARDTTKSSRIIIIMNTLGD